MTRSRRLGPAAALAALTFVAALAAVPAAAASQPSPYVEHQAREIKALSPEEVRAYLAGEGMGLALPAELNGYPGPKHVLELRAELGLGPEQAERVEAIRRRMHADAVRLGESIVELERELEAQFAGGAAEPAALRDALTRLGRLQGELRFAHLQAHLETRDVLTAEQLAAYARLRGYGEGGGHEGHGGHGGHGHGGHG